MSQSIQQALPYLVLLSHAVLIFLAASAFFRPTWSGAVLNFVGKHTLIFGFLVSLGAIVGSLFYSEIIGFEACVLCWWQRVFLYPQAVLFAVALWKNDRSVFSYIIPLAAIAGIIALYQTYVYMGGASLLPCTAAEGACSKIYVKEFGYITIPSMSLTIALYLLFIAWAHKLYRNENRHA